jgi:hypothetical protein
LGGDESNALLRKEEELLDKLSILILLVQLEQNKATFIWKMTLHSNNIYVYFRYNERARNGMLINNNNETKNGKTVVSRAVDFKTGKDELTFDVTNSIEP